VTLAAESVAVILPAAGRSQRFGSETKKIFTILGGRPVWEYAAQRLRARREVGKIVIAIAPDDRHKWLGEHRKQLESLQIELVVGGVERVESVRAALPSVTGFPWIAIHDAARPLISNDDLSKLLEAASERGSAILARRLHGTIKREILQADRASPPRIAETVDRRWLWEALTPQIFPREILLAAYQRWRGFPVTDDAQIVERAGFPVHLVEGSPTNLKITVADDLRIAAALLENEPFGSMT